MLQLGKVNDCIRPEESWTQRAVSGQRIEVLLGCLRLPIVHPVEGHTRLQLDQEGLSALRSITTPVVPVVVIGPYRSGKSFLLNQLLGVGCGMPHPPPPPPPLLLLSSLLWLFVKMLLYITDLPL